MSKIETQAVFLELIKSGLWEKEAQFLPYGEIDYTAIYNMAEKQGVVGLVAAGLEHVTDVKVPQEWILQFIGQTLLIEQRNKAMNQFIAELVEKMLSADINTLLVKGQGVSQCYERPLWRSSGDIDFLLNEENYKKAKMLLLPLSSSSKNEERYSQHFGMSIKEWYVELHGTLRTGLAAKVDSVVDAITNDMFCGEHVRSWQNDGTRLLLPAPNEDVFLVFTHIVKHFYKERVTLRQVCDWCRLLYTYHLDIDAIWLEKHLRKAGLIGEWDVFATLSVEYLGMQKKTMPVLNHFDNANLKKKAEKLMSYILKGYTGNKAKDTWQIAKIFPWKVLRYTPSIFFNVNWLKVKERIFYSR